MEGVALDGEARGGLDLAEKVVGKLHIEVGDGSGLHAGQVAVGIGPIAVEAPLARSMG